MTENRFRVGELRPLELRAECQAAVSTPVKSIGRHSPDVMSGSPAPRIPEWRRRSLARDETGRVFNP